MRDKILYITARPDDTIPHTTILTRYDDYIVLPDTPGQWQIVINTHSHYETQVLTGRVLREIYHADIKYDTIIIDGLPVTISGYQIIDEIKKRGTTVIY